MTCSAADISLPDASGAAAADAAPVDAGSRAVHARARRAPATPRRPPMRALAVADLHTGPTARSALAGIDLAIEAGEIAFIIGDGGGAGTALLRALAGRSGIDGGSIRVAGIEIAGSEADAAAAGLHLVEWALQPERTAARHIHDASGSSATRLALPMLLRAGIPHLAHHPAGTLAEAERRRLAIALAWHRRPRVVLLDAPFAGLDRVGAHDLAVLIRALADDGIAVLASGGDLGAAFAIADRIVILDGGRVLRDDVPIAFARGRRRHADAVAGPSARVAGDP